MKLILPDDTTYRKESVEPPSAQKAQIKPDPRLPRWHEYYPVRVSAPAPCVFQLSYPYAIKITEPWQRLIGDSLSYSRYGESFDTIGGSRSAEGKRIIQAFEHLLATALAFANGDAGFGGATPKTNVLSGFVGREWPRYDKVRVCGGDTLLGKIEANEFVFDSFKWDNPPTWDSTINDDFRMFEATQIYAAGAVRVFPGLDAYPQFLPLISRNDVPIRYDLELVDPYEGTRRSAYSTPGLLAQAYHLIQRWFG